MPLTKEWLDVEKAMGERFVLKGTAPEVRAQAVKLFEFIIPQLKLPPFENVQSIDDEVNGVKYRRYNPKNQSGPLPVAVWYHGGGMMIGGLDDDDVICRIICEATNSVVFNTEYRLAPENQWPAQIDDCMTIYRWAVENASTYGGDPKKFFTGGGSAGATLALLVALRATRDQALKDSMKGIIALVPCTAHYRNVPEAYKSIYTAFDSVGIDSPIIDKAAMINFLDQAGFDPEDADAFVLLATDEHKNFPPTYFASCEYDPLRDDAFALEDAFKRAGVPTKHDTWAGLPHYFWYFPSLPESQQFMGSMLGGIEWIKSQM